jgi:ABC-type Fe3+ transport system permease subunit
MIEFAALGYAIPGAVIAVGILLPLTAADRCSTAPRKRCSACRSAWC